MRNLFASASYSFNNFYNNLNTQGQMVFSLIMSLILLLCFILFIAYIIEGIKNKAKFINIKKQTKKINKSDVKDSKIVVKKEENFDEKQNEVIADNTSEVENIVNAISDAIENEIPVTMTNFEEDQEKTAIISIDELMAKAKELELIDDEENTGINYLEKYNLEPAEIEEKTSNIMNNKDAEVKAFRVSQVISPIYGVKKEMVNDEEA